MLVSLRKNENYVLDLKELDFKTHVDKMKTIIKILKNGLQKRSNREKLRKKLLKAIDQRNEEAIATLLDNASLTTRKAILNPKVDYRTTSYTEDPLHFAIRNRLTKSVALFIPYINDINRQPYAVGTPLHVASQHGLVKIVKLLLTRDDIDLNAKNYAYGVGRFGRDKKHRTALHMLKEYVANFGDINNSRAEIAKLLTNAQRSAKSH